MVSLSILFLAIDSSGKLICERILTIEDDSRKSLEFGSRMLVESLLKDQDLFKSVIGFDATPPPSKIDFDRSGPPQ